MFGPPKDVSGACNARLYIGDDYGDNRATMLCQRAPHTDGMHREEFDREPGRVIIEWERDEREHPVETQETNAPPGGEGTNG